MSAKTIDENYIKRMAELLRQGSTLTELACPACASPLFKRKSGDLWCERCQKKVVVVKNDDEPSRLAQFAMFESLEATLITKIEELQQKIQREQNPDELQKLGSTLTGLLESLEKTRRIKRT